MQFLLLAAAVRLSCFATAVLCYYASFRTADLAVLLLYLVVSYMANENQEGIDIGTCKLSIRVVVLLLLLYERALVVVDSSGTLKYNQQEGKRQVTTKREYCCGARKYI